MKIFTEVFVSITLTDQVEAGNHTLYLRIIEDTEDPNPRYFDLNFHRNRSHLKE